MVAVSKFMSKMAFTYDLYHLMLLNHIYVIRNYLLRIMVYTRHSTHSFHYNNTPNN